MDDILLVDDPAPRVRRLTLNRPAKRNALSDELRGCLFRELRRADDDHEVGVVVVRGAGPCFSAGYDVAAGHDEPPWPLSAADGGWARHVLVGWFEMWDMATPIIGQVHGYCLAGGTELAAACDLLYVADDARIGYPAVRAMAAPDMVWQPWFLGMRHAMEALLTGDSLSGKEAVTLGFANRSFPADELDDAVLAVGRRVAAVPADLQALNKRAVHRSMDVMGIRAAMRAAAELNALGFHQRSSQAFYERLREDPATAFRERDAPFA